MMFIRSVIHLHLESKNRQESLITTKEVLHCTTEVPLETKNIAAPEGDPQPPKSYNENELGAERPLLYNIVKNIFVDKRELKTKIDQQYRRRD